jgi:hypothetical protein
VATMLQAPIACAAKRMIAAQAATPWLNPRVAQLEVRFSSCLLVTRCEQLPSFGQCLREPNAGTKADESLQEETSAEYGKVGMTCIPEAQSLARIVREQTEARLAGALAPRNKQPNKDSDFQTRGAAPRCKVEDVAVPPPFGRPSLRFSLAAPDLAGVRAAAVHEHQNGRAGSKHIGSLVALSNDSQVRSTLHQRGVRLLTVIIRTVIR